MKRLLKRIIPKRIWHVIADVYIKCMMWYERVYCFMMILRYIWDDSEEKLCRAATVFKAQPYSMLDKTGLFTTYDLAQRAIDEGIEGCLVECGVARGGCAALMASVARNVKKTWLFDSFEGLPAPTSKDTNVAHYRGKDRHGAVLSEGYCLGTLEEVQRVLFDKFELNSQDVFLVKGWFDKTLPRYKGSVGKIAFLKLDADWYESVKCCMENLWDNISEGGYVYVDDYHLEGCKEAVIGFLTKCKDMPDIVSDKRGGVWFKKNHV